MPIYDRPTKSIMFDWANDHLVPGQVFGKAAPIEWFRQHYPKIKSNTVAMHVEGMSINNLLRRHHPSVRAGSGHDLFFKLGSDRFRLWDPENDGPARYKADIENAAAADGDLSYSADPGEEAGSKERSAETFANEFAFERDLKNYLVKNLAMIESGLRLYEEEGISGVEYPVGGRYIDILAVAADGGYVVFELKVSRGYDRVVGQLLRYMSWVEKNMPNGKPVRGVIVASEITDDLRLAALRLPDVRLVEYELSFKLRPVERS